MASRVAKWIGSNGDTLVPLNQNDTNTANLYSVNSGALYLAQVVDTGGGSGGVGSPMGLLLALTYAA